MDKTELQKLLDELYSHAMKFCVNIIVAILILIVGRFLIKKLIKFTTKVLDKSSVDMGIIRFVTSVLNVLSYVVLVIIICNKVGIDTTSFVAVLASGGLAIGLALEGSLSNFAGGVLILVTKPFKVGDYVKTVDVEGYVEKIDLIYTELITNDNKSVKVPNGVLSNSITVNYTMYDERRVDVECSVGYGENTERVKEVLNEVMLSYPHVLKDKQNVVIVKKMEESSVVMEVKMWVKTEFYWDAKYFLVENMKNTLEKENIKIPYNQLDVHIVEKKEMMANQA